jgi:hypothetical protein
MVPRENLTYRDQVWKGTNRRSGWERSELPDNRAFPGDKCCFLNLALTLNRNPGLEHLKK